MSGAKSRLNTRGTFVKDPEYTLFSSESVPREEYLAGTFEIPFDSQTQFGEKASVLIPPKGEVVRRVNIRSKLPILYNPLGPGYVYPLYTDQVDGSIYVQTSTLAIQPGDFVGYFNTQFLNAWATNFVGTSNLSVAYDSTLNKFVFTSSVYANIFFQNEQSASFWGFDIRTPDLTVSGYPAFNFTSGTLTAPLTLVQAGWIRGFTPPPSTGFSYVDSVACRLIKEATLTIGGQTIDRLTSERLIIEDDLGVPYENQAALTILEGKNDSSAISSQREYYTRLTFNTDTISMNALKNQDVRVNVEFEQFENLPTSYISSNGFLDGASYVTSNLQAITGDAGQNFGPAWTVGWKNYVIMGPLLNNSFRFYNEDAGTWYSWTPGSGSGAFINTNGGTIYGSTNGILKKADIVTVLATSTTPWASGYNFFSTFPANLFGDGNNTIKPVTSSILTDARYVYLWYQVNYFIIGSTYTSLVSASLGGGNTVWTIVYRFYNKQTSLNASDQTALANFWTTYCGPNLVSAVISGYANSGSDLLVTGTLTYSVTKPAGNENVPAVNNHNNMIWVRYDSTASFTSASSYTFTLTSGGLPASVKDVFPGLFETVPIPNTSYYFDPNFDGRYIYFPTVPDYIAKLDTQNFLSTSAYTQVSGANLNPNPVFNVDTSFISDGRYLYLCSSSLQGSTGRFSRYDSTKSINQQASWEYYTGDTLIRASDFEFSNPCGFDGKYVYFYTGSVTQRDTFPITDFSRITAWHKYDTTKPFNSVSSWEWIDFRPGNVITASDGSSPQITLLAHRTDLNPSDPNYQNIGCSFRFIVGSRYIYITENSTANSLTSLQDFIQYNPITMSGTSFPSSALVKYETYSNTPPTNQISLYGQTDLNEFTIRQGSTTETFQLRFVNPVREIWVVVDTPGVVSRLVLRLNNEILVDDDQVTSRYLRTFESHTTMPTSSNVNVYSFSFDPEKLHPSGTLNMSRIAYPSIDVTLTSAAPSDLGLRVYSKSFNVLGYQGGLGGLLFNSAL